MLSAAQLSLRSRYYDQRVCMSVCVFVCLSARMPQKPQSKFYQIVICGCGSVFLWLQCDTLCTSGFMDNGIFSHNRSNRQNQRRRVCFVDHTRWQHQWDIRRLDYVMYGRNR